MKRGLFGPWSVSLFDTRESQALFMGSCADCAGLLYTPREHAPKRTICRSSGMKTKANYLLRLSFLRPSVATFIATLVLAAISLNARAQGAPAGAPPAA